MMKLLYLRVVLLILSVKTSLGEEGAFFRAEECDYSCHVYDYTVLSHGASSVSDCTVLAYWQHCDNIFYREDTGMCTCLYFGRLSSKNTAVINDMMVPSADGVNPAKCYTKKKKVEATCNNKGYSWIPELQTCIRVYTSKVNFHSAKLQCSEESAHLVMPFTPKRTLALNRFLSRQGYHLHYWIGVDDISVEGSYTWSNGLPVLCTNWYSSHDEPTAGHGEDCVRLVYAGHQQYYWKDKICSSLYGYICAENRSGMTPPI